MVPDMPELQRKFIRLVAVRRKLRIPNEFCSDSAPQQMF